MKYLAKYKTPAALLMLLVFGWLWFSSNLFVHQHNIGDRIVYHSHPYSSSSGHTHSAAELAAIQHMADITSLVGIAALLLSLPAILHTTFYRVLPKSINTFAGHLFSLRAPPYSILLNN